MSKKNLKKQQSAISHEPVSEPIPANQNRWLQGSALDIIVGCAAWSAPLLILAYVVGANHQDAMSIGFYGLALVFNYPHYMATIYRAYRTRGDFNKYKIFTLHVTLLVGLLLVASHVSYQLLTLLFTLYLTWSPFHYSGQNFGIALMFVRRNGVRTTQTSRRLFYVAFLASYAMFFLTVHSAPADDPFILTLGIPLRAARYLWLGLFLVFLIALWSSVSTFIKQTNWRAMLAPVVLLSTQVVWFVIPTAIALFSDIDLVRTRSTAGVLAIMHSAQYIWITSYYARREAVVTASEDTNSGHQRQWSPFRYFAILVLGGVALFIPGPWFVSRILHQDFTLSFLAFTALVNIHHFLLDGAIWKLRDGRIGSLLLNNLTSKTGDTSKSSFGILSRLHSPQFSARLIRGIAALVLVSIAGIDLARYYFSSQANAAASLNRAQQLNPYDAPLQLKLARVNERAGSTEVSRAALERALQLNPNSRQALVAFSKLLVEKGDFAQAYENYRRMFERTKPDVDSLVNFGLLSSQLGHDEQEAIDSWRRAVELDSKQAAAHLYLAEALVRKRNFSEAIPHYQSYLALIASQSSSSDTASVGQPGVVTNAMLKLAAAYENSNDLEKAAQFFTQAAKLGENIGDPEVFVFALVNSARVKSTLGQQRAALEDFRRALELENSVSSLGRASHWVSYGRFLRQIKASPQAVMACYLKAQAVLDTQTAASDEPPNLKAIIDTELRFAAQSMPLAETTRQNLDSAVADALAFKI